MIMAPSDDMELRNMVAMCVDFNNGPNVFRYTRGTGYGPNKLRDLFRYKIPIDGEVPPTCQILPIGKVCIVYRARGNGL